MNNIVLVGYMGSGKTTIGIRLSYRMKQTLLDTDKEIEREQKRSISAIFSEDGEEAFRQMETEYLKKLVSEKQAHIISTGGGMVLREENRRLLKEIGTVIFLRATPETIWNRLKADTTRPLLQTEDPKTRIREMIHNRNAAYEASAHAIIDVDNLDYEQIMDKIMRIMEDRQYENISH